MRIKDIDNAETFQQLVHAIHVAQYGADFQVVDDRGGDAGNDGYIRSRKMLFAIYCPEVRPTEDSRYKRKIVSDLDRAVQLAQEGGYQVETWAFVTPENLREPVQRFVRDEAQAHGFTGICIGETHLTDLFLRSHHIHERFPDLAGPRIFEQLSVIMRGIEGLQAALPSVGGAPRDPEPAGPGAAGSVPSPSVARALQLLPTNPQEARRQFQRIRFESAVPNERMLAGYLEAQVADSFTEADSMLGTIDATLPLADEQDDSTVRSVLRAQKALILNQRFVDLDTYGYFYGTAANLVGIPLVPAGLRDNIIVELHHTRDEADRLFEEAAHIARAGRAYPALSQVFQLQAQGLTQRLILHQRVPEMRQQVEQDTNRVRALHETAIRIESAMGNVHGLATAHHNYANNLRMIGSTVEARGLAQTALEVEGAKDSRRKLSRPANCLRGSRGDSAIVPFSSSSLQA